MHLFTTFEHSPFKFTDGFTITNRHLRLLNAVDPKEELIKIGQNNSLRATQHVGIIRLANLTLQILPKIHRPETSDNSKREAEATQNLLTMLSYAHDLDLIHHAAPLHHQSHDWLELLTRLFATNLRRELHAAPHRAYQSFDDDLPLLRGKLRIADQLRRPDRQHRFACTFDEFSIDNPLNRIFRFVTERLFFQTRFPANRQLLNELRTMLDDVPLPSHCTPADANPTRLITRLNRRYQPTLELARLFLSDSAPHLTAGPTETINFLFDMNQLFEQFIAAFLKKHRTEILSEIPNLKYATISAQHPRKSLACDDSGNRHFQLRPDIVFTHQKQHPLIIDTKYKTPDPTSPRFGIAPADFYQMLAYAHRYHCPHILLLYPQITGTDKFHHRFYLHDAETQIIASTINLTHDLRQGTGRYELIEELNRLLKTLPIPAAI